MVGIGGYGYYYLKTLFEDCSPDRIELSGVVDPLAGQSGHFKVITDKRIP